MSPLTALSPQQLRQAADIQERIQQMQSELARLLGESVASAPTVPATKGGISAAGRARIAAAARARWARERAGKPAPTPTAKKRKMSPAARKRIADIARARWAKAKAAGKTSL